MLVMRQSSHGSRGGVNGAPPGDEIGKFPRRFQSAPGYRRGATAHHGGMTNPGTHNRGRASRFGDHRHHAGRSLVAALEIAHRRRSALDAGAWLAFFTVVPFDLRIR